MAIHGGWALLIDTGRDHLHDGAALDHGVGLRLLR